MCGILAIINAGASENTAAAELHEALYLLQHRGQSAAGIVTCGTGGRFYQCKGNGMASDVFKNGQRIADLPGNMALAHLRYGTSGSGTNAESQPFYVNYPYGVCLTCNGNLINAPGLRRHLDEEAHRHHNTDSDSELMLNVFADELNVTGKARINETDIFSALQRMYMICKGGWACTAMLAGYGVIGFRDAFGIRPLVIGSRPSPSTPGKKDWMMASESVALDQRGFTDDMRDILPGEAVIIPKATNTPIFHQVQEQIKYAPDIFEYVYFARPDSIIDGISVQESRENMGYKLADTIRQRLTKAELAEIDAIIPIPETAITSAACVAERLNKPFCQGFVKNRYVFRTFIMPGQKMREKSVRRKLNPMKVKFAGKNVLLVDDSVVRGTTSREIVAMARESGAKKIFFSSCAPRITDPHIYGIDLASKSELIANHRNEAEIAQHLGAEKIIYQKLEDLVAACLECLDPKHNQNSERPRPTEFEVGVFCGNYVTPVDQGYFNHLDRLRGEPKQFEASMPNKRARIEDGVSAHRHGVAPNENGVKCNGTETPGVGTKDDQEEAIGAMQRQGNEEQLSSNGDALPKYDMDISLHNMADYETERR